MNHIWEIECGGGGYIPKDDRFYDWLKTQKGPRELIIRKPLKRKSRKEEKYAWAVMIHAWAEFCGYTRREAYLDLLLECSPLGFDQETKELITTSDERWTLEHYHDWIEQARMYMASNGCPVPDPNEVEV